MIITTLQGGLGNQMFQYAVGRRLALRNNTELKLDVSLLTDKVYNTKVTPRKYGLDVFNIKSSIATKEEIDKYRGLLNKTRWKFFQDFNSSRYIRESSSQFIPEILELDDNRLLEGYWQTEKYFEDQRPAIREDFQFKSPTIAPVMELENLISGHSAIGVHVRRGDYVTNPEYNKIYGSTPADYFDTAVRLITEREPNSRICVFSDDIEWCTNHFRYWKDAIFIEKKLQHSNTGPADFLRLLAACSHYVISNSTFGWWGAWLGNKEKKIVVAPANWYADKSINTHDICPSNWIRL